MQDRSEVGYRGKLMSGYGTDSLLVKAAPAEREALAAKTGLWVPCRVNPRHRMTCLQGMFP